MSYFWLPNTFKHLPNLGKCSIVNYHLFKIKKKVDISCTQPSLQLEHKQVSWHMLSVTPSGNISSKCEITSVWGIHFTAESDFKNFRLLAEALMARQSLYK